MATTLKRSNRAELELADDSTSDDEQILRMKYTTHRTNATSATLIGTLNPTLATSVM